MTIYDAGGKTGGNYVFVDSEPRGADFALEGSVHTVVVEGKTPAKVVGIDAAVVMIHYADMKDCTAPKPQQREITQPVYFFGRYDCPRVVSKPIEVSSAGLKLSAHQAEVMPGGLVKFTLAAHNYGSVPVSGAIAVVDYDPSLVRPISVYQKGRVMSPGTIQWEVPEIKPGETWTSIFSISTSNDLEEGTRVTLNGRITGNNLVASAQTVSNVAVGVPVMPASGSAAETVAIFGVMMQVLAGAAFATRRMSLV